MDVKSFTDKLTSYKFDFASHSKFAAGKLMVSAGQRAVISNGRIVGPLDADEEFLIDDFALLERYGGSGDLVVKVSKIIKKMKLEQTK